MTEKQAAINSGMSRREVKSSERKSPITDNQQAPSVFSGSVGSSALPSGNKDYVRVYNAGNGQNRVMTHHVTKRNKQNVKHMNYENMPSTP